MILEISNANIENIELLKEFIASMGDSSNSFRYFKSRQISVIDNHLCTVLLLCDNKPIGYGHLDKEVDDVWLGIAISQNFLGHGYGNVVIQYLIKRADDLKVPEIKLSVDENNEKAISLYIKYGFVKLQKENGVLFFSRKS
jgi:ribosomal protein S18 acetylase RimI-like enzyme